MKMRSFRMRILLWTWTVLLGAMAVIFFYSTSMVGQELIADSEARSWQELDSIRWLINEHADFSGEQEFDSWLKGLGLKLGQRISYISEGRVLADSEIRFLDLPEMDDHSRRPEVVESIKTGRGVNLRYSSTLNKEMIYVACLMESTRGVPKGVLRLAVPFSQVSTRLDTLRQNFIWIFLATLVVAALVSALMSRNMSRSIMTFSELARAIGEGGYAQRLRVLPGGEFKPLAESVNAMAEKIERTVQTIEDQKGQLQAIFEAMHEGVMTLDSKGRIESFNAALAEMFNMPESSLGRTPIEVSRRVELQDLVDELISDPDKGSGMAQFDLLDSRTVEVGGVSFFDQKGVRKVILVFHDITAMKRSEKGLKDFVANASHQLRTPLTSIKGYSETLLDNPPASLEDGQFFLQTILKNADHMDKVISSMLALAKSEQMGKELKLSAISGKEQLSRAVNDITPSAVERAINVDISTPEGDLAVMAEPDGLLHVFHNLLNNAVKYSPDNGTISINVEDDGESVVFCVEDQGPGISREHSTKVFERFYRVDENTIDGSGSAGLGLAICRRIVKNFDGEIWHDGYGEGTRGARFCFRLNKSA